MFGLNVIRKVDAAEDSLLVHSLFPTIQGEGPFAGQRAVFIRLAGCSLACSWCDTEFEEGSERIPNDSIFELLEDERAGQNSPLCVITGGEPMRQNLGELVKTLLLADWRVQIESAGIHWIPSFENLEQYSLPVFGGSERTALTLVCSPKTPKLNPTFARYCRTYKYIINAAEEAAEDGLPLYAVSQALKPQAGLLYRPTEEADIFVQPLQLPKDEEQTQRNIERCVELVLKYGYRLSLQQHKMLGLP